MNIPARCCTGYLGDRWYTFDARNNTPRIGRVLMARGRDAYDVALASTFGPNTLNRFTVWANEVTPAWMSSYSEVDLPTISTGDFDSLWASIGQTNAMSTHPNIVRCFCVAQTH
ncbi:MAG: hypothetical protein Fur007_07480 [Rhodoferax sp.]